MILCTQLLLRVQQNGAVINQIYRQKINQPPIILNFQMKSAQKNFMKENADLFQQTPSELEKPKQVSTKIPAYPGNLIRCFLRTDANKISMML